MGYYLEDRSQCHRKRFKRGVYSYHLANQIFKYKSCFIVLTYHGRYELLKASDKTFILQTWQGLCPLRALSSFALISWDKHAKNQQKLSDIHRFKFSSWTQAISDNCIELQL